MKSRVKLRRVGLIKLPIERLHLELTNICNFSCEFCPNPIMSRPPGMISLQMAQSVLDEVSQHQLAKTVLLHVMGEPTLHPNLLQIVAYAQTRQVAITLTTNASRLTPESFQHLQAYGVRQIIISLQTPQADSFRLRGAQGCNFETYADQITAVARAALAPDNPTQVTICFLSSPLSRYHMITPVEKDIHIASSSRELRTHLRSWAQRILRNSPAAARLPAVQQQIRKAIYLKQNHIILSDKLHFQTRILGEWPKYHDPRIKRASFGYCPALQEHFGILWNGDYVYCCTDYAGATTSANFEQTSILEYLASPQIQRTVQCFENFRIVHPACQQCLGHRFYAHALVKQIGSILYFKYLR